MQTAIAKVHATTGRIPSDLLAEEGLQPLTGLRPWGPAQRCTRRVNAEALVQLQGTQYSVPARYCRHRVEVEARAGTITIRSGDLMIASHPESLEPRGGSGRTGRTCQRTLGTVTGQRREQSHARPAAVRGGRMAIPDCDLGSLQPKSGRMEAGRK